MPQVSHHRALKKAQSDVIDAARVVVRDGRYSGALRGYEGFVVDDFDFEKLRDAVEWYDQIADNLAAAGGAGRNRNSVIAAVTTLPQKESIRRRLITLLVAHWGAYQTGMTISELKARLRIEHSSCSSALNYAVAAGWVKDSGETRMTHHDKPGAVWVATQKAIDAVVNDAMGAG